MKDSGIPWIGTIPDTWEIKRVKNIFSERSELSSDGTESLLSVSEYYGVANRSEKISDGDIISRAENFIGYKKCNKGDLVTNIMLAWKGSLGIADTDGIVSPAYCVYKPSKTICPKYYHYLFRTNLYTSIFRIHSKGIIDSRLRLYSSFFYDIPALIPSLNEQQLIATFLDRKCSEIDEMIALETEVIEELKAYKQSVITGVVTKGLDPTVPMKDSGIEWIGEIPEHWEVRRIKYIGKAENGLTYTPSDVCDASEGVLVLRSSNIQNGKLVFDDNVYVRSAPASLMVKVGDIIICSRNGSASLVGKSAVVENDLTASFGAFMMRFRSNHYYKYINFLLTSTISHYKQLFTTTTINQLTIGLINNIAMPFIESKEEQQAIAEYLDTKCTEIDNLISIKLSKIDSLNEYKKSIIYEYVTGKKEVNG